MRFGNINEGETVDPQVKARVLVAMEHNDAAGTDEITAEEVYVVWFCYILGGWKALLSTFVPNDKYYEVTHKSEHDGSDGPAETYVDTYVKLVNTKYTEERKFVERESRSV